MKEINLHDSNASFIVSKIISENRVETRIASMSQSSWKDGVAEEYGRIYALRRKRIISCWA